MAGAEAAERALKSADIERADFVFMFCSVGYPQEVVLGAVRERTAEAPLVGCSGEGVIAGLECDESNFSVGVMVLSSDELGFHHGVAEGLEADSEAVGREVGAAVEAIRSERTQSVLVLADGLTLNFDRFLAGFEAVGSDPLPLFGGTAADNWQLKQTYQFHDGRVLSDGLAWVALSGDVRMVWGVNHGCVPLGTERQVTRSKGNIIYEIDGKPVLDVLREYLVADEIENWQKAIVNLCLGFRAPEQMQGYDEYLIRFMPSKDDEAGSVTIPTEVEEGCSIWMTRRDQEKIAGGIDRMAEEISRRLEGKRPHFVLQFDCAGRGKAVLRDQAKSALMVRLQEKVGPQLPWLGFYTYGEIGPVGDQNCFHNYTAVVLAVV